MKKIWFGIGAIVIIILLLLQTRFNKYLQLDDDGYAIQDKTVKTLLMSNPDELVEEDLVPLCGFKPLDYIYTRANSYYLGEEKKTQIDLSFPLLINGGAGVWFLDDSSTLFDVYYDEYGTYRGLTLSEKISYNPTGEKASPDEYLFAGLRNGYFINLDKFTFVDNGDIREVSMNSIINFTEDYFIYCEQEDEQMRYQVARNMLPNSPVYVNGEELTYHQLLLNLHVISDKNKNLAGKDIFGEEELVPTPEVLDVVEEAPGKVEEPKITPSPTEKAKKEKTQKAPAAKSGKRSGGSSGSNSKGASSGSKGVRPDSMRADKKPRTDREKKEKVQGYVKPEVAVKGVTAGVFRISLNVDVKDPAKRINNNIGVQFEIYDITNGENNAELVERIYTLGSNDNLTAAGGTILPNHTYKIVGYYAYNDEYDDLVTESLVINPNIVTTKSADTLGPVYIRIEPSTYRSIPIYYDTYVVIKNVEFTADSDQEAIYGIDPKKTSLQIYGREGTDFNNGWLIDRVSVNMLKQGGTTDIQSPSALQPNSAYKYAIQAMYYTDELTIRSVDLRNNTGEFYTCKARPKGEIILEKEDNILGKTSPKIRITDVDASSIKPVGAASPGVRDIYLVISTEKNKDISKQVSFWDKVEDYLEGDRSADNPIHYAVRMSASDYSVDTTTGALTMDQKKIDITGLDLNTKYYAYLVGDYCLMNEPAVNGVYPSVYHGELGSLEFRTAGLTSLGNVYVTTEISNVTAHTAQILYTLNTDKTNDVLEELLSNVTFDIKTANGEEVKTHSSLSFDRNTVINGENYMTNFTGWGWSDSHTWEDKKGDGIDLPKSILMGTTYFDGTTFATDEIPYRLNSMTDYKIEPKIYGIYNGKEYLLNVTLSSSKFKTYKEPASVTINNLIFAAGTLKFDVRINDPDETIIGNSGHVVTMNIYDTTGKFIRAVRIPKNTFEKDASGNYILDSEGKKIPSFVKEQFTGLDPSKRYKLRFVAQEYNEGYDLTTYESPHEIDTYDVEQSLNITGSIKLQKADEISETKLKAYTRVDIQDNENPLLMSGGNPYYIRVEKDGVDISANYPLSSTKVTDYVVDSDGHITSYDGVFDVDKGLHNYKLTLYIIYHNNELVLDTLTFTTEKPIIQINNCKEFIEKIKANGKENYKYCVTGDLNFTQYDIDRASNSSWPSSSSITSVFNGEIDFQGYTVTKDKKADGEQFFNNIGPSGEIYNAVFEFSDHSKNNIYDEGILSNRNYGHIHDVIVNYRGGNGTYNQYYGLLCRINSASGIIERFVVNNAPEEGSSTFTARNRCGLVCDANYGIVRYGYVYGKDINSVVGTTGVGGSIQVGGIAGLQGSLGQMYDVFSLVNVVVSNPSGNSGGNQNTNYGAIIGESNGSIHNGYSIGQSLYNNEYVVSGVTHKYNESSIGPAVGKNNKNTTDIYYWNEAEKGYPEGKYQNQVSLESLYDYSWQGELLGGPSIFDASTVEVGYYPHVVISDELPEQEYIPLPGRSSTRLVDIVASEFIEYMDENETSALIKFRFTNPRNAAITKIDIDGLTTEILNESQGYEITSIDGYTTLYAKVSNPTKFLSKYEITSLTVESGGIRELPYTEPKPILNVDFYRLVHDPEEWYKFVVQKPTENARLANDIDFAGIAMDRIRVTSDYTGKLDGGINGDNPYGFTIKNINIYKNNASYTPAVFNKVIGEVNNLVVENLTLRMSNKNNNRAGFVGTLDTGSISNVHLRNVEVYGKEYIGSLVGYMNDGSVVENCSASGGDQGSVKVEYTEPANTNTDGAIGGLVGYAANAHVRNCFVTDLDLDVPDIKNCKGAGGVVGWSATSALENLYASGDILARGVNIGGIVGMHSSSEVTNVMKNLISRVDVSTYQDMVGGIAGTFSLSQSPIDARNNMTGVAFGNVFCKNSSSTNVSYTIGFLNNYKGTFYGSDFQLINGMINVEDTTGNTAGLISYEEAMNPSTYTDSKLLNMESGAYNYSYVQDTENGEARPHLPHLYYHGSSSRYDSSMEMPFQKLINISEVKVANNLVQVRSATVNTNTRVIRLELVGPKNFEITGFKIDDLEYSMDKNDIDNYETIAGEFKPYYPVMPTLDSNGVGTILLKYKADNLQKHYFDSYNLMNIEYKGTDSNNNAVIGKSDYSANPVRVPLTLYKDIGSMDGQVDGWNTFINATEARNYGNYENYRIVCEYLNFASGFTKNTKIGRLIGKPSTTYEKPKLINININGSNENFIFRLNSEMSGLIFENCTVDTKGRQCSGLVGSSAAEIYNMEFNNIMIKNNSGDRYCGLVAFQTSGCFGKPDVGSNKKGIILNGITIDNQNTAADRYYTGGITGFAQLGTRFTNIRANNVTVLGNGYEGGIAGAADKAYFEDIQCSNFTVQSRQGPRVGGVIGSYAPGDVSSEQGAHFIKVSISGEPTYNDSGDKQGYLSSSNTVISMTTNGDSSPNYIGGLIGYSNCYYMGRKYGDSSTANKNTVDNIIVRGLTGRIGGAYGYTLRAYNTDVNHVLLDTVRDTQGVFNGVGGISGEHSYELYNCTVKNTLIDMINHGYVGLISGYKSSSSGTMQYDYAENSMINLNTSTDNVDKVNYVGGAVGYAAGPMQYQSVYNSKILASNINYVGGVTGYLNHNQYRCYYYANPESGTSPTADASYLVKGRRYVGGVVGYHNTGELYANYSNANVEAETYNAGGLEGYYRNNYTVTQVSGADNYSYSTAAIRYSYFAGSVKAKDEAGGLVGYLGMASVAAESIKNDGGRRSAADGALGKSGSDNEVAYTYCNSCFASTIKATDTGGKAYAFAGNIDGFEGKANRYNASGENFAQDVSTKDRADRTLFWEGTKLISGTGPEYDYDAMLLRQTNDSAPAKAKNTYNNTNNQRYISLDRDGQGHYITSTKTEKEYQNKYNVRLVSQADLETVIPYYVMGMKGSNSAGWQGSYYYVLLPKGIASPGSYYTYYPLESEAYLPHVRVNNNGTISDSFVIYQTEERADGEKHAIKLPVPHGDFATMLLMARWWGGSMLEAPQVYASDVDKINVELSQLPEYDNLYFKIYYGDQLIDTKIADRRVYTYEYDFKKSIRIEYGYAYPEYYQQKMDEQGKVLGTDYELIDCLEDADCYYCISQYDDEGQYLYSPNNLTHRVMTYGDKYYYISSKGVVSGTGSGSSDEESDDRSDPTATLLEGKFVTIYNGKALNRAGEVIDLSNGSAVRTVKGLKEAKNVQPLIKFAMSGAGIETYWKHTDVYSGTPIVREAQILKSALGNVSILPGTINNVKDSAVLYTKDGNEFLTVLEIMDDEETGDRTSRIVDMYQGENINAPEDFKTTGIVYMSNNFNTTAPFIVVQYQNGGIVGYNYMTGKYLFDNSVENPMGLIDYFKVYFEGDKSELAKASLSYAGNARIAEIAGEPERLYSMLPSKTLGNDEEVNDPNAETYKDEESDKIEASFDTETAGSNKALRTKDNVSGLENTSIETFTDTEDRQGGDNKNTLESNSTESHSGVEDGNVNPVGSAKGNGVLGGMQGLNGEESLNTKTEGGGNSFTDIEAGITGGNASGDGEGMANGEFGGDADNPFGKSGRSDTSDGSSLGTGDALGNGEFGGQGAGLGQGRANGSGTGVGKTEEKQLEGILNPEELDLEESEIVKTKEPKDPVSSEEGNTGNSSSANIASAPVQGGDDSASEPYEKVKFVSQTRKSDTDADEDDTEPEEEETVETVKLDKQLKLVFNAATGTYEILDMDRFLREASYVSENAALGIRDFSAQGGFATETKQDTDETQKKGIALYILAVLAILGGVGGGIYYKKKNNLKV